MAGETDREDRRHVRHVSRNRKTERSDVLRLMSEVFSDVDDLESLTFTPLPSVAFLKTRVWVAVGSGEAVSLPQSDEDGETRQNKRGRETSG